MLIYLLLLSLKIIQIQANHSNH